MICECPVCGGACNMPGDPFLWGVATLCPQCESNNVAGVASHLSEGARPVTATSDDPGPSKDAP